MLYLPALLLLLSPAQAAAPDPCEGKKYCVTIYVAPWCPACKQNEPLFRQLIGRAEGKKQEGVRVVVGRERKAGDNARLAAEYGKGALADDSGEIFRLLRVNRFPSFFVLENGKPVHRDDEAMRWVEQRFGQPD